MRTRRIRLAVVATALATVGLLVLEAAPALADVTEVETQITVSAPERVQKRTSVTFSGQLSSADPRCVSNVTLTVTKPTPLAWQITRRRVVQTSDSGSFSYTKRIYFTGTWTFSFEGFTISDPDGSVVCLPSTVQFHIRAKRR